MLIYIKALFIMLKTHWRQRDKGGNRYIWHPLKVSMGVPNIRYKVVALLHDVLEDSSKYSLDDFSFLDEEQKKALILLTHKKEDSYFCYIDKIRQSHMATVVKLEDLKHNIEVKRIKNPTTKDYNRIKKYKKAMNLLIYNNKKIELVDKYGNKYIGMAHYQDADSAENPEDSLTICTFEKDIKSTVAFLNLK